VFGVGGTEFIVIAVVALLLFGPDKLPQFGRTIGRFLRDFKRYQDVMEATIRAEMYVTEGDKSDKADPFKKGKDFREKVQQQKAEAAAKMAEEAPDATVEPESEKTDTAGDTAVPADSQSEEAASDDGEGERPVSDEA